MIIVLLTCGLVLSAGRVGVGQDKQPVAADPAAASQPASQVRPPGGAELAGEPVATKIDGGYEISFALTAADDVTVRVLDSNGQIVRRLACGMVGLEKAAAPLAPGRLAQRIVWDGKDDAGQAVGPGDYTVQVAVGASAKFDRFVLWEKDTFASLRSGSIAVGPGGLLYMANHQGVHYGALRLFGRDGKYVKSLWPVNPAIEGYPELMQSWGMVNYDGRTVPISVNHSAAYFYSVISQCSTVTPKGLVMGFVTWGGKSRWAIQGEIPVRPSLLKVPWCTHYEPTGPLAVAVGPEGDFYIADRGGKSYRKETCGYIVARVRGPGLKPVKVFEYNGTEKLSQKRYYLGTMHTSGNGEGHFKAPSAVAVTPDGTIIVSDAGALKVFRKDGMFLKRIDRLKAGAGELPAGGPLAANAKTGAIYVIASAGGKRYLLRLASIDDPTVTAEILLSPRARQLAVDSEAHLVWVMRGHGDDGLLRVKDLKDRFEATAFPARKKGGLVFPNLLAVAPDGRLYVVNRGYGTVTHTDTQGRYAGQIRTGAAGSSMATGAIATDRHGNLYVAQQWKWGAPEQIEKYSPAGKRLNFGDKAHLTLEDVQYVKGLWIAPNDDIYVAVTAPLPAGEAGRKMMKDIGNKPYSAEHLLGRVDVYSPDGALKQKGLVKLHAPNGLALGRDGSVYTVETYLHHGAHKMRLFKRKYKTSPQRYRYTLYDKLLKFPARGAQRGQKDALWAHPGIGGTSPWTCGAECCAAQVTVDADDRIWCHDGVAYSVKALDAAGNLVLRVGSYGNEDCLGGGGDQTWPGTNIVRKAEVPLARPSGVAVRDDALFIADQFAGRVVRCKLQYAHSKKVALKID